MANRQELQLENRAATEAVAEKRKNGEKDDCIHARDAIQPRSKTPEFLWPMRFLGATAPIPIKSALKEFSTSCLFTTEFRIFSYVSNIGALSGHSPAWPRSATLPLR
jgi:hypothetical protein